jgi:hypothetical protein
MPLFESRAPASCWFLLSFRMKLVKSFNFVDSSGQFSRIDPLVIREASFPFDSIFQASMICARVHNVVNFASLFAIDENERWRWRKTIGNVVGSRRMKEGDVEDIMDVGSDHIGVKLQAIGRRTDFLRDWERTEVAVVEFFRAPLGSDVGGREIDEIAYVEDWSICFLEVVVLFVAIRGDLNVAAKFLSKLSDLREELLSRLVAVLKGTGRYGSVKGRIDNSVGSKGSHFDTGMVGVVVAELGDRKEAFPVVLLVVTVHADVLFDELVDSFGLTISLRVEGGRHVDLSAKKALKGAPKFAVEDRTAIGDDIVGCTVSADDIVEVESSDRRCIASFFLERDEMGVFGEAINDDEDGVVAFDRLWKFDDEIHRDTTPRTGRDRKWIEASVSFISRRLVASTGVAGVDIVGDPCFGTRESVLASEALKSVSNSGMSS